MTKLQNMFSDFGYNIKLITPHIINIIFGASDDSLSTIAFINLMIKNKDIGLLECDDGVDLLFPCDNKTVYFMNLKNTNLIDNYVSKIKYKNKRRCQICLEKQSKHFKICWQCNKEYCNDCFIKTNQICLCCPFCRYTMKMHIANNIKKFSEDESKIFKYILEAK